MVRAVKKTVVAGFLLGLCAVSLAAEQGKVTGAFGFELGQELDPAGLKELEKDEDGGPSYAVAPENPYGPLTDYAIAITPATHRIYRIIARGSFTSMQRCREELVRLEEVLERKYDKTSGSKAFGFNDSPLITFGQSPRKIRGKCTGTILRKTLTVIYFDEELAQTARAEGKPAGGAAAARDDAARRDESGL